MQILIVEDSAERLEVLKRLAMNHEVITADAVNAAKKILAVRRFDIVFLDFDLADGEDSLEVANSISGLDEIPAVVIHSANPDGVLKLVAILPHAVALPFNEIEQGSRRVGHLRTLLGDPGADRQSLTEWFEIGR